MPSQPVGAQQRDSGKRDHDVEVQPLPFRARSSGLDQDQAEDRSRSDQHPCDTSEPTSAPQHSEQEWHHEDCRDESSEGVQQDYDGIEDIRLRERVEIGRRDNEERYEPQQGTCDESQGW